MAKLNFCVVTHDIETMFSDGRAAKGLKETIRRLEEGYSSREFLALAARLLSDPDRGVGRPAHFPREWLKIGEEAERMADEDIPEGEIDRTLGDRFGHSPRQINRIKRRYRAAKRESDRIARE